MVKTLKVTLLLLIFLNFRMVFALNGEVIALEAPLFLSKDLNSQVVQYVRKGDVIHLQKYLDKNGPKDNDEDMDEQTSQEMSDSIHLQDPFNEISLDNTFYTTVDRNGRTAYIPKKYVKIIYNDTREYDDIGFPLKLDDTDYRLLEPLPKNYPLAEENGVRALFTFGIGQNTQSPYPYSRNITNESTTNNFDFFGAFARAIFLNSSDYKLENKRLFFGGMLLLTKNSNYYEMVDFSVAREERTRAGVGPFLSYDAYQTEKNQITFLGGFMFNFSRATITQDKIYRELGVNVQVYDKRHFQGFALSSRLGILYQRLKIFEKSNLDFICGLTTDIIFPYTLKAINHTNFYDLWNRDEVNDRIGPNLELQSSIVVGIQTSL